MYTEKQLEDFIRTTEDSIYGDIARELAKQLLEQVRLSVTQPKDAKQSTGGNQ
jgi:hypothetical protein